MGQSVPAESRETNHCLCARCVERAHFTKLLILLLIGLQTLESCHRSRWGTAKRLAPELPLRQFKKLLAASTQLSPPRSFVLAFIRFLLHPAAPPPKSTNGWDVDLHFKFIFVSDKAFCLPGIVCYCPFQFPGENKSTAPGPPVAPDCL